MTDAADATEDSAPCTDCGGETPIGQFDDGDFVCSVCDLRRKTDVVEVLGEGVVCECGAVAKFRYKKDAESNRFCGRPVRKAGLWICQRCKEVFDPAKCEKCEQEACLIHTTAAEVCHECLYPNEGGTA